MDRRPYRPANEVMHPGVFTIDGMATAAEAIAQMKKHGVTALVVERRGPEDAWGTVSLLDLARGVISQGLNPAMVNVYEIMTKPIVTIREDMDAHHVAQLFVNLKLRRAPVSNAKGELVGMITLSDVVLGIHES